MSAPSPKGLCPAACCREPGSYGAGVGDAAGELVFFVEDFLVVVADFFAGAVDFLVVAAVELVELVVVTDSFLLAHDDMRKPMATRAAIGQITDCFIGCG